METLSAPVTARRIGPSSGDLTTPKVFYLSGQDIKRIAPNRNTSKGGCVVFLKNTREKKVELYESAEEVRAAIAATGSAISADPYVGGLVDLAVTGVSGGATTTAVITKYFNKYVAGTGASGCLRLPPPSDRNAVVIVNGTSAAISVYPNGASGYIDSGASGVHKVLPAWKRMHFVTTPTTAAGASARWKTALDKQFN